MHASERYDIALGADDQYVPHAAALIASVIANAPGAKFRFIVLHGGIAQERLETLRSAFPEADFVWLAVTDDEMPKYVSRAELHYITAATLFRLGIEKLAPPDCRRVLYLDSDMTVTRDVRDLWAIDLEGSVAAAVVDPDCAPQDFASRWGLPPAASGYFNAGVLFIDLERVRAEKLFAAAIDFVARNQPPLSDQDGLNWALWNRWRPLDQAWNYQPRMIREAMAAGEGLAAKAIVHYTGANKPWVVGAYHPWAWLYWRSLARTPFLGEVVRARGVGRLWRLRLWLRWLLRRPHGGGLLADGAALAA
jgi:lipopolysaccharide biosynthesis glycosyltransferase